MTRSAFLLTFAFLACSSPAATTVTASGTGGSIAVSSTASTASVGGMGSGGAAASVSTTASTGAAPCFDAGRPDPSCGDATDLCDVDTDCVDLEKWCGLVCYTTQGCAHLRCREPEVMGEPCTRARQCGTPGACVVDPQQADHGVCSSAGGVVFCLGPTCADAGDGGP